MTGVKSGLNSVMKQTRELKLYLTTLKYVNQKSESLSKSSKYSAMLRCTSYTSYIIKSNHSYYRPRLDCLDLSTNVIKDGALIGF